MTRPPARADVPAGDLEDEMEEPTLSETLASLREAMRPMFDERRAVWEREGPAAMAAFEATGAKLDNIGGNCPVQAEGEVDGERFYFRARGDSWQFHVAPTEGAIFDDPSFYIDRDYGEWPDAGWMPNHEAIGFIVQGIGEFRALSSATADDGQPDERQEWADYDPDC